MASSLRLRGTPLAVRVAQACQPKAQDWVTGAGAPCHKQCSVSPRNTRRSPQRPWESAPGVTKCCTAFCSHGARP